MRSISSLRQMTGQGREPLAGNRRHGGGQPRPAPAVQREEAQIQPKRRRLAAYHVARGRLQAILHRRPDQRRAVSIGIVAKKGKQHPHGLAVPLQGPLPDAAMALQPDQETRQMTAGFLAGRRRARRDDAGAHQVREEHPDPGPAVGAAREAAGPGKEVGMRAGARRAQENGRRHFVIDLSECDIVQVEPDDEVPTALTVSGDRIRHISLCCERPKERLHHAAAGLDLRGHSCASCLQEEAQEPVQVPVAALKVLAEAVRTGTGAVVLQEAMQDADVERLDAGPAR